MVLETIQPVLSNYFLNPAGLLGLAALIPLIIFYLVKKDPERKVMPSFMFFQSEGDSESTSRALKIIQRNLVLILQIIAITAFAFAFAEPYTEGTGSPENSVLILDRSGSMAELSDEKNFLKDNIGKQNSVIVVDSDSRLLAENIPPDQARSIIDQVEPAETGTDIISGLRAAQRLQGDIFIASDLDQTISEERAKPVIESMKSQNRNFKIMETERRNRHGIIGLDVGEENTTVDVKNFEKSAKTLEINLGEQSREATFRGESVETVTFNSRPGRNT
ncbi:MAG: hypothetical protein ACI9LV_000835, partial [Candidatus Nanohaloarchaea archaeon]